MNKAAKIEFTATPSTNKAGEQNSQAKFLKKSTTRTADEDLKNLELNIKNFKLAENLILNDNSKNHKINRFIMASSTNSSPFKFDFKIKKNENIQ